MVGFYILTLPSPVLPAIVDVLVLFAVVSGINKIAIRIDDKRQSPLQITQLLIGS